MFSGGNRTTHRGEIQLQGGDAPAGIFWHLPRLPEMKKAAMFIAARCSSHLLGQPVAEMQIFPYLAPFMAVFEGFFGVMLAFAKRVFGIANDFIQCFDCFCHSILPFVYRHPIDRINDANRL